MSDSPTTPNLSQFRREELLRDGYRVLLRPIEKSDVPLWLDFFNRLSDETKYFRFHNVPKEMTEEDALRYCTVDYDNSFAYAAEIGKGKDRKIIAVSRYYRLPNRRSAEVAIAIEDAYQNIGLGTRLIQALADIAREKDISVFESNVLVDNQQMMETFRDYGFHVSSELQHGVYTVTFPIKHTQVVDRKEAYRDRIATVASLQPLVNPKSVAIIGAARAPGTIGNLLMRCILQSGYSGIVYPVNPNTDAVLSVKSYPSVMDIPGKVDLAIIAVPAAIVNKVADECGQKGVRGLIVISDGFRERNTEGAVREDELRIITLSYGMRLVGPNCMGIINTDADVKMNATFSQVYPNTGNVAFLSQSGAMGLTILEHVKNLNVGISTFVSVGNRADVSSNDFLQYWEQDPATKVILLYLESFGNPDEFAKIARRVSAKKPIVAVKSGTTAAGARAASSHTGALATSDVASDVLFKNAGIIRVNSVEELLNLATLLSTQPLPKGRRLVIVTNGGGPGIIAADAASRNGLEVQELSADSYEKIRPIMKRGINVGNPIDTTAGATAQEYEGILRILAADENVDAVLAIFAPPIVIETKEMEDALRKVAPVFWRYKKPLLGCFIGQKGLSAQLGSKGHYIPLYVFPEEAIQSLRRATEYSEMRSKPIGNIPIFKDIQKAKARELINTVIKNSSKRPIWLSPEEIEKLLSCYGIHQSGVVFADTIDEAKTTARKLGYPVAVKLASATITHKTDVGGVVLNVDSDEEVEKAYNTIAEKLEKLGRRNEMSGVTIQRMMTDGIETIVGVTQDPSFGPLMLFGSGGIYAELIKDVTLKLHPITDSDALEMINSVRMSKLFDGYRGSPPSDVKALQELLLRVSAMVEDIPEIAELDLNPVNIRPVKQGYWVIDARIMVK
ncbi:MAG: GNAT family N-acetyltransferase [Dehalococcoidales bacterium]|nr:GNAT family N-acetyltransferase [Dehalococcoidales bacterium]